jgi:conjugal transfer pilus assembly protein TraV
MSQIQSSGSLLAMAIGAGSLLLGGCTTLSGVGGEPRYACQAPTGAQCNSVSGIYANTGRHSALPHMRPRLIPGESAMPDQTVSPPQRVATASAAGLAGSTTASGSSTSTVASEALRSPPRLLRLWVAPWEDSDGDLHEASTVHMIADFGRWQIERVKPVATREVFAMPPAPSIAAQPGTPASSALHAPNTLAPLPPAEP